jgi:hypothetical protein
MAGINIKLNKFSIGADGAVEIKSPELATELLRRTDEARKLIGEVPVSDISFGDFGELRIQNKDYAKLIEDQIKAVKDIDELAVKNGGCGLGC